MNRKTTLLVLVLLLFSSAAFAANEADYARQKIRPELLQAIDEEKIESTPLAGTPLEKAVQISGGKVRVLITSSESELSTLASQVQAKGGTVKGKFAAGKTIAAEIALEKLEEIAASSAVKKVWPDFEVMAVEEPLQQINAESAWELNLYGEGKKIAVLDTGIDETHPALQGKVAAAENFSSSATATDAFGHGTHVAGIIAGSGEVQGIAPQAKLLNGKVLNDSGSGTASSVIAGINWAIEQQADVINLSLGAAISEDNTPLNQAVKDAIAQGIVVVVAAGNCGQGCPSSSCNGFVGVTMPGNTAEALTVGAIDSESNAACFSGNGTIGEEIKPDLTAPGVAITSSVPGGTAAKTGTSMSTPFAAGAAALVLQQHPEYTALEAKQFLEQTALDLGEEGEDTQYGWGLLDLSKIGSDGNFSPDQNDWQPPDDNGSDVNFTESGFIFQVPDTLYKKQAGTFDVWHPGTGGTNITAQTNQYYDAVVEFAVLDEFGNILEREFIGPIEYTDPDENHWVYEWTPERVGEFTVQATIYREGVQVSGTQASQVSTATTEKQVKATVPDNMLQINSFNAPAEIEQGTSATFSINVSNNGYLDVNATAEIRFLGDENTASKIFSTQPQEIKEGETKEINLNPLIELANGNYTVQAIIHFEDKNASTQTQTRVYFPEECQIRNASIPASVETNTELQGTMEFANNASLATQPLFFGKVLDGDNPVGYLSFSGSEIEAGATGQYAFSWTAEAEPKQYELELTAEYSGNTTTIKQLFNIVDTTPPTIENISLNQEIAQNQFNPIQVQAFDQTGAATATATITAPNAQVYVLELAQTKFFQNSEWSKAFTQTEQIGTYSATITACDAHNNCTQSNPVTFNVQPAPTECEGKNILLVANDKGFYTDQNQFNWMQELSQGSQCTQLWKQAEHGTPTQEYLSKFNAVVWATGNTLGEAVNEADTQLLTSYAASGGRLLLSGSEIASEHVNNELMQEIAHAVWESEASTDANTIEFNQNSFLNAMPEAEFDATKAPFFDTLIDLNTGEALASLGEKVVMTHSQNAANGSKTVFSAITLNALNEEGRTTFLNKVVEWLLQEPEEPDEPPTVQITYPNYANLATAGKRVYVRFNASDPENKEPLTASLYFDEDTNQENGNQHTVIENLDLFQHYGCSGTDFTEGKNCYYSAYNAAPYAADGQYYYLVKVSDGKNTASDYSNYPIMLDSTPPQTTLDVNENTLAFTCSDTNGSGCYRIYYRAFAEKNTQEAGLLGYWKLDGDTAGTMQDYSGNGNNGTVHATYKYYSPYSTVSDKAMYFYGNTHIEMPSLEPENKTLMAWIYPYSSNPNEYRAIGGTTNAAGNAGYYLAADNYNVAATAFDAAGNKVQITARKGYGWQHATLVHDASNSKLLLYLNGVKKGEAAINGYTPAGQPLLLGTNASKNAYFKGYMDEAALYSKALTAQEIQETYEKEKLGAWQYAYYTNTVSLELNAPGEYTVQYYSYDRAYNRESQQSTQVTIALPYTPLTIDFYSPQEDPTINEGESQAFSVNVNNPAGNPLAYQWLVDSQATATNTNTFSFYADYDSAGTHDINVTATDGISSATHHWKLTAQNTNRAPQLDPISPVTAQQGQPVAITLTATDPDNDSLTFYDNTTMFDINPTSGAIAFTPTAPDVGTHDVNIWVSDSQLADSKIATFTITAAACDNTSYTSCATAHALSDGETKAKMCGDGQYYKITTTQTCDIKWSLSDDTSSDYDIYTKYASGSCPTKSNWDCRPYSGSSSETCSQISLPPGTYYAMVDLWGGSGEYSISASLSNCGAPPALKTKSDSFDGFLQQLNGSTTQAYSSSVRAGHYSYASYNYIRRGVLEFHIGDIGTVQQATFNLDYSSKSVSGETCTFDLYSTETLGAAIDASDWDKTAFEKVKDNWFDQTIYGDISVDVTDAWNNAINAGREYLSLRIAMDNEENYTSTTQRCMTYFYDTGHGGTDPHISYSK